MLETQSVLHNMSAPPKSRLVIAPHRQSSVLLTFQLSFVSEDQWQQQLLQQCGVQNWAELQCKTEHQLSMYPPPAAMSIIRNQADIVDNPLLAVAILSRCVGNLFLLRRQPELSWNRLSQSITISDRQFIQQLVGLGER